MSHYLTEAAGVVGEFWTAVENGEGYVSKLKAAQEFKAEMETKAKKLLGDIADWAANFEYWDTLDHANEALKELYQIRAGVVEMDDFEEALAASPEWCEVLDEMQEAA